MKNQTAFNIVFNVVGAFIGLIVVGYVVYSALHTEFEPPCSARYPAPTRFALQMTGGAPLSPIELQARVGLREWGLIENATIVSVAEAPAGAALQVKLASVTAGETTNARPRNGVDFRWSLPGVKAANTACLSYSVWLPEGFAFNDGGVLPGIVGGKPDQKSDFGSRLQWRPGGVGELTVALSGSRYRAVNQGAFTLPQGRWTSIEQEIVLNTPGTANGMARLWVDGQLKAEDATLPLRADGDAKFTGVLADIGYLRAPGKVSELRLSAFEIAWR